MKRSLLGLFSIILPLGLLFVGTNRANARDDDDGRGREHHDMKRVGTNDLQARSSYQPTVHRYSNNRWILFVGHHALGTNPVTGQQLPSFNRITGKNEPNGTSILDVSDPRRPKFLVHIPVGTPVTPPATPTNGGAQFVRVCDGSTLPIRDNKVYMLRGFANSAHEVWDVTDPSKPLPVRTVSGGNPVIGSLTGTHKNWWECDTGIAYIVGRRSADTAAGWRPGNHIMIFNLGDPANPVFIRDWALDGQQPGSVIPFPFNQQTPPAVPSIHGPISTGPAGGPISLTGATGNRVYFAYGTESNGAMQIVDRSLLLSTPANDFKTAEVGRWVMSPNWGGHTSFPIGKISIPDWEPNEADKVRDFVVVVSEETNHECTEGRHLTFMVDATTEARPHPTANFQVPESEGNFCSKGGRFGPHATNEEFGPPFYQKIVFVSYFNAGVRAIDVRDPNNPQEVAFFIPKATSNTDFRCKDNNIAATCKIVIQTNNVATDDRGYVYIVDRANTGLHVLRLTGDAAKIAGFRDDD